MGLSDIQLILVLVGAIVVLVAFIVAIVTMNDWHMTSLNENTARAIVVGRGNVVRFLVNSENKYLADKKRGILLPALDASGKRIPEAIEPPLSHWSHESLGVWWVSGIWPVRRVHEFTIPKSRLLDVAKLPKDKDGKVIGKTGTILDRIERDPEPATVSELLLSIEHPVPVMQSETKDNFNVNVLVMVVLGVTDLLAVIFKFGGVKFFKLLDSAISAEVNNYILTLDHDEFIKKPKGRTSPLVAIIKSLNRPQYAHGHISQPLLPFPGADKITPENVYEAIQSWGIGRVLGVEIEDVWIEAIDPDDEATGPVQKIQAAEKAAEARIIQAKGERKALVEEATGQTETAKQLREILGDPGLVAQVLDSWSVRDSKLTTAVRGAAQVGVMVNPQNTPTPPATPPGEQRPEKPKKE